MIAIGAKVKILGPGNYKGKYGIVRRHVDMPVLPCGRRLGGWPTVRVNMLQIMGSEAPMDDIGHLDSELRATGETFRVRPGYIVSEKDRLN